MGADRPDWLPAGWNFIVKTRSCGKKDKYYVNPSGTKFNSKPEVLRHLKISKKIRKPKAREKVELEKALALPPGWIKKTVTTKKKGKIRKDPYYIDPVSGRQFRSVPEAFRYLGSMDSIKFKTKSKPDVKSQIYPFTRAARRMSSDKKLGSENDVISDSRSRGETSCSKQSEDGDSLVAKLPDKMEKPVNRKEKDRNLADEKVNIRVDEPRVLRSGSKVAAGETIDTAVKNKQRKRKISSITSVDIPNEQPHVKGNEHHEGGIRKSKRLSEIKSKDVITNDESLQSGTESTTVEKTMVEESNQPEQSGKGNKTNKESEHDEKVEPPNRRKVLVSKWSSDSPRRNPRRHSGLGVDSSSSEIHKNTIAGKESKSLDEPDKANIKTYDRVKLSAEPEILLTPESTKGNQLLNRKEKPFKSPGRDLSLPKEHKGAAVVVDKKKEPVTSPDRDLSLPKEHKGAVFAVDQKEQGSKLISGNNAESSLNDLLLDPCIEFAIKTLTGEIPIEDITKVSNSNNGSPVSSLASPNQTSSSSVLPSGDILADPCFEFAIKTLTGDVSAENGSQFQISFEQPRNPLGSGIINGGLHLPRFTLENYNSPSNHPFSPVAGVKTGYPRRQEDRLPNALCGKRSESFVNASPNHGFVDGQSGTSYRKFK